MADAKFALPELPRPHEAIGEARLLGPLTLCGALRWASSENYRAIDRKGLTSAAGEDRPQRSQHR